MRNASIREKLIDILRSRTPDLRREDLNGFCAQDVAAVLNASRSLISQYLNELVVEGTAIKVNTRPVYYFHRSSVSGAAACFSLRSVYESMAELREQLETRPAQVSENDGGAFRALVGAEGSLAHCVEQCKAAVAYPGNGLPVLLQGATGTGKTLIARLMYEYGLEKGLIRPTGRFVHVNCSEYADNPELFLTNLFGYKKGAYTGADRDREGLLALADGGVLFLDEVHCLKNECQEKLFQFMDKNTYHMIGDNDVWYASLTRMILATTENPENVLLRTLLRRIPITVRIPPLAERPAREKKELIRHVLLEEETRIGRSIGISAPAFESLLAHMFPGNAGDLLNGIRAALANAFLRANDSAPSRVVVHLYDLPHEIIRDGAASISPDRYDDRTILVPDELCMITPEENGLYVLHREILLCRSRESDPDSFLAACLASVGRYLDRLYYGERPPANRRELVTAALTGNICNVVAREHGLEQPTGQETDALARFLCDGLEYRFSKEELDSLRKAGEEMRRSWPSGWAIASELVSLFRGLLGQAPSSPMGNAGEEGDLLTLDLFLFLKYFHRELPRDRIPCIVVAHGLSTASSLAGAVNHLLGCPLFDAIDMPADCSPGRVIAELSSRLRRLKDRSEAVILVDMGSLEDLAAQLESIEGLSIGIVNNVTTRLALEVGAFLLEGKSMEEALKSACERNSFTYTCIDNRRRRNVTLSVCATGIATAAKIADLIARSLPPKADIVSEACDYSILHEMGAEAPVFSRDRVLFIVGTLDPRVPGVPFVPVEEIIAQEGNIRLGDLLSEFLSPEESAAFDRQLIKNFSLMNLLDHLTILNPEKVVSHVEKIINDLQQALGKTFRSGMIVGLYLHIGCLVERLVTDRYIFRYPDEESFARQHRDFIRIARRCFEELEKNYGVEIPVSEIGYLYEYISYILGEAVSKKTDTA